MNARAAIVAALESAEQTVATLRAALAALDGAPAPSEWVDMAVAVKITKASRSSLRRWAKRHGCGEQTPTGHWRFRRAALLELATCKSERGANGAADGANGAGDGIHISVDQAHLELQHEEWSQMPFSVSSTPPERETSTPEGWKFRTIFGRERDEADRLPATGKEKLIALRSARDDARAVKSVPYDRMKEASQKALEVERRIAELTNWATTRYAADHPLVAAERESLAKFKAEARQLSFESERRKEASSSLIALVTRIESYVADLPKGVAAAAAIQPKPLKGESPEAAVARIRDAIAKEEDNLFDAINAPIKSDAAKEIMRRHIEELAHRGRPNVLATLEGRRPPVFATKMGEKVFLHGGASGFLEDSIHVEATLCWLHRDALIKRLEESIDEDADDSDALDDSTRAKRIANAKANILALSREEEFYIVAAASMGATIHRRADADPRAVLGLADSAPQPRDD